MPTKAQTKPEPPTAAVAADAHWAATRERLRNRARPVATLTICDDHDAKEALRRAQYDLRVAKAGAEDKDTATTPADVAQAELALADAQAAFDDAAIVLRFQALARSAFDALKREHPPTEEQAEEGEPFNVETLAPELIAAASLDGITADDAREFFETWATGEAISLWNTAFGVQGETRMDVGKG